MRRRCACSALDIASYSRRSRWLVPETAPGVKTRVPVVTGEIGGPPVSSPPPEPDPGRQLLQTVLAGPTLAIARDPVQYSRNLAGEAAAAGATGLVLRSERQAAFPG